MKSSLATTFPLHAACPLLVGAEIVYRKMGKVPIKTSTEGTVVRSRRVDRRGGGVRHSRPAADRQPHRADHRDHRKEVRCMRSTDSVGHVPSFGRNQAAGL